MKRRKKPWLAAVLNVLLCGSGYLYVGKRTFFGVLLIVSEILGTVLFHVEPRISALIGQLMAIPVFYIPTGLTYIAFAVDAYKYAQEE